MRRLVAVLLVGEVLMLGGLWMAWPPLAPIAAGVQIVAAVLLRPVVNA